MTCIAAIQLDHVYTPFCKTLGKIIMIKANYWWKVNNKTYLSYHISGPVSLLVTSSLTDFTDDIEVFNRDAGTTQGEVELGIAYIWCPHYLWDKYLGFLCYLKDKFCEILGYFLQYSKETCLQKIASSYLYKHTPLQERRAIAHTRAHTYANGFGNEINLMCKTNFWLHVFTT